MTKIETAALALYAVWYQQLAIGRLEAAAELCLVKRAAVRARLAGDIQLAAERESRFERLASDFSTRWINETARAKAVSMARALGIV